MSDWKIVPAGTSWAKEGNRVKIGDGVEIGQGAFVGDYAVLGRGAKLGEGAFVGEGARLGKGAVVGDCASLGDGASLGKGASLGEGASLGRGASLGEGAVVGNYASLGEGAVVGPNASNPIDIGFADGYRKTISQVNNTAYIGAGCRWFTLSEAITHWMNHKEDRSLTMLLLESAKAIATAKGWEFHGN